MTLSYAIMQSHPHLLTISGSLPPSRFYGPLHTRYAKHWHSRFGGLGPVLAERPKNFEVQPERVPKVIAYNHRNPSDAGVVRLAVHSSWTSHRAYLRLAPRPPWLNVERGLALCGFPDTEAGRRLFDQFVNEVKFDDTDYAKFGSRVEYVAKEHYAVTESDWRQLKEIVAIEAGIVASDCGREAGRRLRHADRLLCHFAFKTFGVNADEVASRVGRSRSSVYRMLREHSEGLEVQLAAIAEKFFAMRRKFALARAVPRAPRKRCILS